MRKFSALIALCAPLFLAACGASSPEDFIEKLTAYGCENTQTCDPDAWELAGFSSVNDCVDKTLDAEFFGGTFRDFFVASCEDFDKGEARTCLAAARKAKSDCSENTSDEPACDRACGSSEALSLELLNPAERETMLEVLEELVAAEEAAEAAAEAAGE